MNDALHCLGRYELTPTPPTRTRNRRFVLTKDSGHTLWDFRVSVCTRVPAGARDFTTGTSSHLNHG